MSRESRRMVAKRFTCAKGDRYPALFRLGHFDRTSGAAEAASRVPRWRFDLVTTESILPQAPLLPLVASASIPATSTVQPDGISCMASHSWPVFRRDRQPGKLPLPSFSSTSTPIRMKPTCNSVHWPMSSWPCKPTPWREDDAILLGDLNVSYQKLGKLGQIPNIAYPVRDEATNTRGSKSYDSIVFDRHRTPESTGLSGILSLQETFGLSTDQALEVSDHQPV